MFGEQLESQVFIDGDWAASESEERLTVVNPYSEHAVARVPAGSRADIDRAVAAARDAFDSGPWPRMSLDDRVELLTRLSNALQDHADEFAEMISVEMGCPISQSRTIQVQRARERMDSYVSLAASVPFESVRDWRGARGLVTREAIGVVAAVIPWNTPQATLMMKIPPALLAGCTVILKPSPETPLDSYLLAEIMREVGFPRGVINVVPADRDVSEYLVTHPGVDKVSFTGSTAAGRRIASLCGRDLRPVTLELGGKSAALILEDADVEQAVEALRLGSLRNSGQVCSAKTRVIVHEGRRDEFLQLMGSMMTEMPVGDPMDPLTEIGPMVTSVHRDRVNGYIELGIREGARVVVGGTDKVFDHGWFVQPTLFDEVEPGMRIFREEIFGPVIVTSSFRAEEQAIELANTSDFGLNGAVFSADSSRALAVARQIQTGTVEINGRSSGMGAPQGGVKASGMGREGGFEGFEAYLLTKSFGLEPEGTA